MALGWEMGWGGIWVGDRDWFGKGDGLGEGDGLREEIGCVRWLMHCGRDTRF